MYRSFIFIFMLLCVNSIYAQELTGKWEVTGTYPNKVNYKGELACQYTGKGYYSLEWRLLKNKDSITQLGTAVYLGESARLISSFSSDAKRFGLFAYELNEKGGLEGTGIWTSYKGKGAELIGGKLNKNILEGTYEIVGRRPQGDINEDVSETYKGTLSITKNGKRYDLTWQLGDNEPYNGFGYVSEEKLIGVWGIGLEYGLKTFIFNTTKSVGTANWSTPKLNFATGTETILLKQQ